MAYLSAKAGGRTFTKLEMLKLHVLTDLYHVLDRAMPVIGGKVEAWQHGPVVHAAYRLVGDWAEDFNRTGQQPGGALRFVGKDGNDWEHFKADVPPAAVEQDFSADEIKAMDRAWSKWSTLRRGPHRVNRFFHEPDTFFGKVWSASRGGPIDWIALIDAYDAETGEDHADVKFLIAGPEPGEG